jgi:hypothetical protein
MAPGRDTGLPVISHIFSQPDPHQLTSIWEGIFALYLVNDGQGLSGGDAQLPLDQVHTRHHLRHRVLHLQPIPRVYNKMSVLLD